MGPRRWRCGVEGSDGAQEEPVRHVHPGVHPGVPPGVPPRVPPGGEPRRRWGGTGLPACRAAEAAAEEPSIHEGLHGEGRHLRGHVDVADAHVPPVESRLGVRERQLRLERRLARLGPLLVLVAATRLVAPALERGAATTPRGGAGGGGGGCGGGGGGGGVGDGGSSGCCARGRRRRVGGLASPSSPPSPPKAGEDASAGPEGEARRRRGQPVERHVLGAVAHAHSGAHGRGRRAGEGRGQPAKVDRARRHEEPGPSKGGGEADGLLFDDGAVGGGEQRDADGADELPALLA